MAVAVGEIQYSLLGPLTARRDGQMLELGWARQQAVLAVLLLELNRPVPVDRIIDAVWGVDQPRDARNALQTYVSRLRKILQPDWSAGDAGGVLLSTRNGYLVRGDPRNLDTVVFERRLVAARAHQEDGDVRSAVEEVNAALELWRGEPLAGLEGPVIEAERRRLRECRLTARELHTAVRLDLGEHDDALADVAQLVSEHPLRERLRALLMLALYRCGRQAEALQTYADLRRALSEELGIDPSPELQHLFQQILSADPNLTAPDVHKVPIPRQLPPATRHFVGRVTELTSLTKGIDEAHDPTTSAAHTSAAVTAIIGTGGVGKTALVLHWAHANGHRFPDGQLFVDLQGFSPVSMPLEPTVAVRGFLDALGVEPGRIPVDLHAQVGMYRSLAAGKRMLIVLDNAANAEQVMPLLPGSSTCTVIATSRNRLGGLATAHDAQPLDVDVLPPADAQDLLASCLGSDRLENEPEAVSELLAVCAGLPLAVRIVAARAEHHPKFPLEVLVEELRDTAARMDALDAGDPHSNLRVVLSWSTRALNAQVTTLFWLLGIAPGPDISLPAAVSLAGWSAGQVRAALRELEHASLVQQHTSGRYRMHDLIRLYATDTAHHHLAEEAQRAALRRVLDFCIHTAYAADRLLHPHRPPIELGLPTLGVQALQLADIPTALAWFDTEHLTLLAGQQAAARHAWHTSVWQLAWVTYTFHVRRRHRNDSLAVWQAAVDAATHLPDTVTRIRAHRCLGQAYIGLGDHEEGIGHLHRALALADQHGHADQQASAHRGLAWAWEQQGDSRRALEHATRALGLCRVLGQPVQEADTLNEVGWLTSQLGEYDTAREYCQAALVLHRQHHNPEGEATTLDSLGYIAHHTGHHHQAIRYYQQALTMRRSLGNISYAAGTLDGLGHPHVAIGQYKQARTVWQEALELYRQQFRDADVARVQRQLDGLDGPCGLPATSSH
ncbi:tetratricopeptide repeat protein [Catenulispora sp. NF23]|uniref:AfsR/SARP family transcriptional regulator n=1 Tax=Catenulispora pinistramenti TaxID=2705254 RepID=UPI001BA9F49B|nr:BTAD domain-containing putative transcriptional regulator [Catenulispora pinistramenti]MBS2531667.1 tetratricopeptide repeat protein [Catenulispora pinistramenti]